MMVLESDTPNKTKNMIYTGKIELPQREHTQREYSAMTARNSDVHFGIGVVRGGK
jgi:hypothetical protein